MKNAILPISLSIATSIKVKYIEVISFSHTEKSGAMVADMFINIL